VDETGSPSKPNLFGPFNLGIGQQFSSVLPIEIDAVSSTVEGQSPTSVTSATAMLLPHEPPEPPQKGIVFDGSELKPYSLVIVIQALTAQTNTQAFEEIDFSEIHTANTQLTFASLSLSDGVPIVKIVKQTMLV
jgi:hypothetical protein